MSPAILYKQTVSVNGSSTSVTLDHSFSNANYTVGVEMPYNCDYSITNKTSTGFTLNVNPAPMYGAVNFKLTIFYN